MPTSNAPVRLHLFTYQVGFGDCFLLRFVYTGDKYRHVLIDFGTTGLPPEAESSQMLRIAQDIKEKCGPRGLDAVVATHRHADHISGFATKANGKGSGDVIRSLKPRVVLQPWTEKADLPQNARSPGKALQAAGRHALALNSMNAFSQSLISSFPDLVKGVSPAMADKIRFIGEDNIKNVSAVKNLGTMGTKNIYAYHGSSAGLGSVLPGVKTRVLGPPTLEQTDSISTMRSRDDDEYWHLQLSRLGAETAMVTSGKPLFPRHRTTSGGKLPLSARWLARRINEARGDQLLQIVTSLDSAMNNTSLILLFEVGKKKLLFPGDAQIENWQYAFSKKGAMDLLGDVDLYKVGHHGSLNATPKAMWRAFRKKGPKNKRGRLTTVLSTMPGKHGGKDGKNTEVPRKTLLKELGEHSELHSTHTMKADKLYDEVILEF